MNLQQAPVTLSGWQPDRNFWIWHLLLPLIFASVSLYALEHSGLDLWLADQWFDLEGQRWAWRNNWISYDLIHHYGKEGIMAFALIAAIPLVTGLYRTGLSHWRLPMSYLLATMALVPTIIALIKHISPVSCPWDMLRYGGHLPYLHTFDHHFGPTQIGHCFPSGHASGGFILLAVYFAALPVADRPARFLLPGVLVGCIFALGQQSRGAHFLSHDIWTLCICWFGALSLFLLFRPAQWPLPMESCALDRRPLRRMMIQVG